MNKKQTEKGEGREDANVDKSKKKKEKKIHERKNFKKRGGGGGGGWWKSYNWQEDLHTTWLYFNSKSYQPYIISHQCFFVFQSFFFSQTSGKVWANDSSKDLEVGRA